MDLQELSKANLVLFGAAALLCGGFWFILMANFGVCGKLSTFRLCGAGVAHSAKFVATLWKM